MRNNTTGQVTTLVGVERLQFDDQAVALDLASGGSLQTAISLLAASFGAKNLGNTALLGEFIAEVDAHGLQSAVTLMAQIGLLEKLAGGSSMADVLTLLHSNVAGRAPNAAELKALLDWQQAHDYSVADLILLAASNPLLAQQIQQLAPQLDPQELAQQGLGFESYGGAIIGTTGDDLLQAVTGVSLLVDGREGIDTLQLEGNAADYLLNHQSGGSWQLTPVPAQAPALFMAAEASAVSEEVPTVLLQNMERLAFSDFNVALDLQGNAGLAARLLAALMGPDAVSNKALAGEAIAYVDDVGAPLLAQIAQANGFLDKLAGGSSMQALIELLYTNIAGRSATQDDMAWTMELVQQQGWDKADLLMYAAQLPETAARIELSGLGQSGLAYEVWQG